MIKIGRLRGYDNEQIGRDISTAAEIPLEVAQKEIEAYDNRAAKENANAD